MAKRKSQTRTEDPVSDFLNDIEGLRKEQEIREDAKIALSRDHLIRWSPPDPSQPVVIAPFADLHIGCRGTDYEALDRAVDTILGTDGLYVVLCGDGIDNHIRHISAMLASNMRPKDQWAWFGRFLAKLAPKIIAIVSGNHEQWTKAVCDFDPLKAYSKLLLKPYREHAAHIKVSLRGVTYTLYARHKYRFNSSFNPGHSLRRLWDMGPTDWDVGMLAHTHELACEPFTRHGKLRYGLRPGTFQINSAYAEKEGFYNAMPCTPAVMLMPEHRDMCGVHDLNWAAMMLKGYHSGKAKSNRR